MGRLTYKYETAQLKIIKGEYDVMWLKTTSTTPTIITREEMLYGEWFVK